MTGKKSDGVIPVENLFLTVHETGKMSTHGFSQCYELFFTIHETEKSSATGFPIYYSFLVSWAYIL